MKTSTFKAALFTHGLRRFIIASRKRAVLDGTWTKSNDSKWGGQNHHVRSIEPLTQNATLCVTVSPLGAKAQEYEDGEKHSVLDSSSHHHFRRGTSVNTQEPDSLPNALFRVLPLTLKYCIFKYLLKCDEGKGYWKALDFCIHLSYLWWLIKIARLYDRLHIHIPNVTRTHAHTRNIHTCIQYMLVTTLLIYNLCPVWGARGV